MPGDEADRRTQERRRRSRRRGRTTRRRRGGSGAWPRRRRAWPGRVARRRAPGTSRSGCRPASARRRARTGWPARSCVCVVLLVAALDVEVGVVAHPLHDLAQVALLAAAQVTARPAAARRSRPSGPSGRASRRRPRPGPGRSRGPGGSTPAARSGTRRSGSPAPVAGLTEPLIRIRSPSTGSVVNTTTPPCSSICRARLEVRPRRPGWPATSISGPTSRLPKEPPHESSSMS